jgi:hypothetical protein
MLEKCGSATVLFMAVAVSALVGVTPAVAQVSLYHMDFKPADFNASSPGLAAGELNIGPNAYAMPGFGWDETHGQQNRPGVYYPAVAGSNPEDPNNRAFMFLFGTVGQTNSSFTSTTTPGSTFPSINPTLPANAGLGFSWSQHLENTNGSGFPVHVRVAVQTAGGSWYASNGIFNTGTVGAGSQGNFDPQQLLYNPLKANWLNLTIGVVAADGVTIGSQPAADLTGNITGIGFIGSFDIQSTVPGDVTGDRIVDINDYNIIKAHFGTNVATRNLGDVTGDGVVNLLDFAQWKGNFPFPGAGAGSLRDGTVPEPASAVLMALSLPLGCGLLRLRKKSSARRLA